MSKSPASEELCRRLGAGVGRFASATLLAVVSASTPLAAEEVEELPVAYRCSGNEPFWGLSIEGPRAVYTALGEGARELGGSFRTLDYAGLFVYRGAQEGGEEWVAFVLQQSCEDTMADANEGGGRMPFAIGLSLPGGDVRVGCCRSIAPGAPEPVAEDPFAGTRWRLVEIQSMDDAIGAIRPDDPSLYTLTFGENGQVSMRLNCNRGTGSWKATPAGSGETGSLSFGPLAMTRALCPPPSLDERIARDTEFVRGYLFRDGRLALSLEADAAIYLWEPDPENAAGTASAPQP